MASELRLLYLKISSELQNYKLGPGLQSYKLDPGFPSALREFRKKTSNDYFSFFNFLLFKSHSTKPLMSKYIGKFEIHYPFRPVLFGSNKKKQK